MAIQLSRDLLDQARMISGHHSMDAEMVGQLNGDQRRVLGLLEALDYGCFDSAIPRKDENGIYCITLGTNTKEDVQKYLVQHKTIVQSLPMKPFVIGLMAGTFDFLQEGDK